MQYIILCGGSYRDWDTPKQLTKIREEPIVARTIRLLREQGVENIAISSNNPAFYCFGVPVIHHENHWVVSGYDDADGTWVNAFPQTPGPACFMFGDVVFSEEAVRVIVNTETDDVEFFASSPPFSKQYPKKHAEPFAFKVANMHHFRESIRKVRWYEKQGRFKRHPIAWELWQVIKGTPLNRINYRNYVAINDYTCDIDWPDEAELFRDISEG